MTSEAAAWHATWLRERPQDYGADVLQRIQGGLLVRATEYLHSQQMRTLIQQDFAAAFQQRRRGPVADGAAGRAADRPHVRAGRAVQHGAARDRQPPDDSVQPDRHAGHQRAVRLRADGLPVGLQIMAPAFAEPLLLQVAAAYEAATDWHRQRPPPAALTRASSGRESARAAFAMLAGELAAVDGVACPSAMAALSAPTRSSRTSGAAATALRAAASDCAASEILTASGGR